MFEECTQMISANPEAILTGYDQTSGGPSLACGELNLRKGFARFIIRACVCVLLMERLHPC